MKRKTGIIVCVLILFTALSSLVWNTAKKKEPQLTTLIVVRHAEKNNETDTTTLTAEGYDRANRLAELLSTTDLAAVYTTPYTRLRLTAEPTARQKNLPIQDYTPHDISEIDRIISANLSKTVLIVGHSNTIPAVINHYCGTALENLRSYNDIFVLSILNQKINTNRYLHFYY